MFSSIYNYLGGAEENSNNEMEGATGTRCILVTGGAGYIGTHTIVCLLNAPEKYSVVVIDNLSNSSEKSLDRVAEICNLTEEEREERLRFFNVDICDEKGMKEVFESSPQFESCIHFAGLKVGSKRLLQYSTKTSVVPCEDLLNQIH